MASALSGIRILDITHVWSGPLAGKVLADLGAKVIHIQSRALADEGPVDRETAAFLGTFPDDDPGVRPWDRHALGNDLNRNKMGLSLELNTPAGVDIFKRLVALSDVVLDNFSPRVMENFGLDYTVLKEVNPGIIMCAMPGYGLTGPYRDHVAFGTTIEPAAGLTGITGYPGETPQLSGNPYPDAAAAMHAAAAILTALYYREKTGMGQQIDLSQCESATCLMGEFVVDYTLNGVMQEPTGNRHPCFAPYGCYPCRGDDKWITIEIETEEKWRALVSIMGNPPWAEADRFLNIKRRREKYSELDDLISKWTSGFTHMDLMGMLQEKGIPAGAVLNAKELMADPHLNRRQFFKEVNHPETGSRLYPGCVVRFKHDPDQPDNPAPMLGQHNEYVLKEILGLQPEEITRLEQEGVIGKDPL
jgi:crotonobetainyl-CoA:carnitine CoA-transferase CaiB-like acyl-CoA transferase